jgi:hypothetical protein
MSVADGMSEPATHTTPLAPNGRYETRMGMDKEGNGEGRRDESVRA